MQEFTTILSPAGFLMDVSVVAPVNGTGTMGRQFVSSLLPGGGFHTRGSGTFDLTGVVFGRQGTLRVNATVGAAGTAQSVAFLALSSTVLLGIALDTSNRPYVILKDANGTTVGQTSVLAGAVASGTPMQIDLAWNSQAAVYGGSFAGVMINNSIPIWSTNPTSSWAYFIPSVLYVGTTLGALGLGSFTGVIGNVQVSNQVTFPPMAGTTINVAENLAGTSTMVGTATWSAAATVI